MESFVCHVGQLSLVFCLAITASRNITASSHFVVIEIHCEFVPSFAFCPGISPASQCGALEEDNSLSSYCMQLRSIRREGGYRSFRTTLTINVSPDCCWMVQILKSILDTPPKAPARSRMEGTLVARGSNQYTFVLALSSFLSHIPPILPPALRLPLCETTYTHIFISHLAFERNSGSQTRLKSLIFICKCYRKSLVCFQQESNIISFSVVGEKNC